MNIAIQLGLHRIGKTDIFQRKNLAMSEEDKIRRMEKELTDYNSIMLKKLTESNNRI